MSYLVEEKIREAACLGDVESVQGLIAQNVNINAQNRINGWTALHWACKRGHEEVVRILLNNGADINLETSNSEKPVDLCSHLNISQLLGESSPPQSSYYTEDIGTGTAFIPNYIKNAPINGKVELNIMPRHSALPITSLPSNSNSTSTNAKVLVLKVRVSGSCDPDFIEVELSCERLLFSDLLLLCCEELGVSASQVERLRKLPNTRLRNDSDVGRLIDYEELEVVLKGPGLDKFNNSYQSISSCKDQTILY